MRTASSLLVIRAAALLFILAPSRTGTLLLFAEETHDRVRQSRCKRTVQGGGKDREDSKPDTLASSQVVRELQ